VKAEPLDHPVSLHVPGDGLIGTLSFSAYY